MKKNLRILLVCLLVLVQTACGFKLRGSSDLPAEMKQVFVYGIAPTSEFARSLHNTLLISGGQISDDRLTASVILHVLNERRDKREISLSIRGKANEYELYYELTFELHDAKGTVILPQQTIEIVRDYFNPQIAVIAKSEEEAVIWREMHQAAVRTLLQRARGKLNSR